MWASDRSRCWHEEARPCTSSLRAEGRWAELQQKPSSFSQHFLSMGHVVAGGMGSVAATRTPGFVETKTESQVSRMPGPHCLPDRRGVCPGQSRLRSRPGSGEEGEPSRGGEEPEDSLAVAPICLVQVVASRYVACWGPYTLSSSSWFVQSVSSVPERGWPWRLAMEHDSSAGGALAVGQPKALFC